MKKWLILILFSFWALTMFSADTDVFDPQAAKERILDQRQNYFLTSTDTRIAPRVNPITGEYCEEEADLIVAGSQPLSARRFYHSNAPYDPRYASWRYNPECFLVANLELKQQEIFASIGDVDGSICSFTRSSNDHFLFEFEVPKGFLTFQTDGTSHPLNTKIHYWRFGDPKDKKRYQYRGTITDGSGRIRSFTSAMHRWTDCVHWTEKKRGFGWWTDLRWRIFPNTWTPYHIPVTEEKLPNGNILCYTYTPWKKEKQNFPLPQLLSSITAYNADKTKILGFIHFHYPRTKHDEVASIQITGSDNRTALIQHAGKSPINLASTQDPGKPPTTYAYHQHTLETVSKPDGRILTTEYNQDGKVSAQYAPVGPNAEMHPIGRYRYSPHMTQVIDAENNQIDYHFDDHKRLRVIAYLKNYRVYRQEHFDRDPATGNVLCKTIADTHNTPFLITEYTYDEHQNPILETIGDGKECHTIERTFSDFNLKESEKDRDNKTIRYTYLPQTNLPATEFTYENDTIRKRIFHTYDDSAIRIKTLIDDGTSADPHDLNGVTYRKITEIKPKQTLPCFGLPEEILEKTLDPSGREILLKKVRYTYTPFGKVLTEEHFDADEQHCYTLHNTYDKQERLTSTTDPLGNTTQFTYDPNHNLTSIRGPNPGQYKEITYDQANRPICISDWQTDGTILRTRKKYDRLGQVITEIDACGHETHYTYDMRGRVIAVHHPDGAIEKKEYDVLDNVIAETDPNGYVTRKEYNFRGQPTAIYYPNGQEEHFTYNPTGTITTHIDKNGAKTCYTYDIFDHPTQIKTYSSSGELLKTTTSTYTPFCKLCETDSEGITTTYTYDFCGRKIAEQTGNKKTRYFYDRLGRLTKTAHQDFQILETYDHAGQLISKKIVSQDLQFQEEYAYDPSGNRTHLITSQGAYETLYNTFGKPLLEIDPLNFATTYAYRFDKAYTEVITDANGIKTLYTHNPRGHIQEVSKKNTKGAFIAKTYCAYDPNGNLTAQTHVAFDGPRPGRAITHHWEYGPMGRLERFLEAEEKETRYLYDAKGRLSTIVKPSGIELHHEWDDLGRLKRYYASDFDYTYTYDRNDRLLSVYDAISQTRTSRTYDELGNLIQETLANGLKLANTYDDQGRRIELTLPDDSTIRYVYKGAYLYQVSRNGNVYTYASRDLEGNPLKADFPSGQITITRDPLSRWQRIDSAHYSAHFPKDAYDPVGNLLCYTYRDASGTVDCAYQYDAYDQLISENTHTYHFDSLHNRMEKDGLTHQVNNFCQTIHDGHTAYRYDPDGNLISDGKWHYDYDSQGRLIILENESMCIEYAYDPFHRRLSKTVFSNGQSHHQEYIWDGDNEIGAISEGELTQLRVLGEGFGAEIGAAVFYELNGETYVPIHDHRGCVVALADTAGNTLENYRYTAFGEELTENHLSPWRFSGKRVEEESGLVFFGRRYYFPELGKWITQDPEGFEDGPNLYAYLHNRPLADYDPYGLFSWGDLWGGTRDFLYGAGDYLTSGIYGMGYGMGKMGEWMVADFQYEYFNDRSFFQEKSYQAVDEWKAFGRAAWDSPLDMIVPGIMEAWRDPTSAAAWGKAAVDLSLIYFSAAKLGSAANLGRAGRIGEELSFFGKSEHITSGIFKTDTILTKAANSEVKWCYGAFKSEAKWTNQMAKRGWTSEQITEAISKGKSYSAINMINKSNSATRYIHPTTGKSIVIDDITNEVIHIGGHGFKY